MADVPGEREHSAGEGRLSVGCGQEVEDTRHPFFLELNLWKLLRVLYSIYH